MATIVPRPIIGVIGAQYERKMGGLVSGVSPTYLRAVEAGGGIPLLIHLSEDQAVPDALYERCDGLLFHGGGDVDPARYGAAMIAACGKPDPLRDQVELHLAQRALAEGMPILGICRGIQLLNVAMGGTLWQDIPSELPESLDHYASLNAEGRALMPHTITIESDSWLAEQLGTTAIPVNTFHHQALKQLGEGLRVVATATDGIIEAVEGTGNHFVMGVQCHPEDLWNAAEPRWLGLFRGFVAIAAQATTEHYGKSIH
jgi:putative glutamine amidotransferase